MAAGLALAAALLVACAAPRVTAPNALPSVELDSLGYQIEQLTDSTWTATPRSGQFAHAQSDTALVKAIEQASHCQVTDSGFGPQGHVFNAQVDCGSRLKN